MKKSFFATAIICVMALMPMSVNANIVQNTESNLEMQSDYYTRVRCASPEQVDELIETIKHTTFDSDKKRVAMQAIRMRPMNASSIRRVAQCFTFDSDKKEILKFAFPYCVNQADYYQVLNVLTFSSDKDEIMRFVDEYLDSHCSSDTYYEERHYEGPRHMDGHGYSHHGY